MTDSIQIHSKKPSFILALSVTSYSVIATYLNVKHQIYLMEYTTPVLLATVGIILSFSIVQKITNRYLTANDTCFSFGKHIESIPVEIRQPFVGHINKETTPQTTNMNNDYTENYEIRIAEIERKKASREADIMREIHEYTTFVMAEFLTKDDLATLHENIDFFAHRQCDLFKSIRSRYDNPLASIDIRHFVWNIGIRLNIPLEKCAEFIKNIFPHELENATLFYLSKNLRTIGTCKISLDIPLKGDYHFNCLKKANHLPVCFDRLILFHH